MKKERKRVGIEVLDVKGGDTKKILRQKACLVHVRYVGLMGCYRAAPPHATRARVLVQGQEFGIKWRAKAGAHIKQALRMHLADGACARKRGRFHGTLVLFIHLVPLELWPAAFGPRHDEIICHDECSMTGLGPFC